MKIEVMQFEQMEYVVRYPNGYMEGTKGPLIIFLHGAGSRGKNMQKLLNNPFFRITNQLTDFPFVTVAPQCSENTWFDMFSELQGLVRKVANEIYVDTKQIYLIGASMGGYAVWQLAMSMPEYFAAICPICGGGMYWNAGRLVNVPVWAFHGKLDETVLVEESEKMVKAINRRGGNARLTVYQNCGHDAWSDAYRSSEVYEWLLSHRNNKDITETDEYNRSDLYG